MAPSFFKVMIGDFSTRLPISPTFVKLFPVLWSQNVVKLQNSKGSWLVELKKTGDYIFFERGWSSFVLENSLEIGEFLVFKFSGKSKFRVTTYGIHGVEKDLAASPTTTKKNYGDSHLLEKPKEKIETTFPIPISLDDEDDIGVPISSSKRNQTKTASMANRSSIRIRNAKPLLNRKNIIPKKEKPQTYKQFPDQDSDDDVIEMTLSPPNASNVNQDKQNAVLKEVEAFKSVHPFFKATMGESYMYNTHLNIPATFAKHMNTKAEYVTLVISNNPMQLKLACCGNSDRYRLYRGWHLFIREHNLKQGDQLIFELIDTDNLVFRVSVFRSAC